MTGDTLTKKNAEAFIATLTHKSHVYSAKELGNSYVHVPQFSSSLPSRQSRAPSH